MDRQKKLQIVLFSSDADKDEDMRDKLVKHLSSLKAGEGIELWHEGQILPGEERASLINRYIEKSAFILLLISPDFLASEDCCTNVNRALAQARARQTWVIPVILRPCDWKKGTPFSRFHSLPSGSRPVTSWNDEDDAYLNIVEGVRGVVERSSHPENRSSSALPLRSSSWPYSSLYSRASLEQPTSAMHPGDLQGVPPQITPSYIPDRTVGGVIKDGPGIVPDQTGFLTSPTGSMRKRWRVIITLMFVILFVICVISIIGLLHV